MPVFHQMGHQSNNLIDLPEMSSYAGAIFSPINCTEAETVKQVEDVREFRKKFEIIFDPQFYVPATERGNLRKWAYFPKDVDTADLSSLRWWEDVNKKLSSACQKTSVDAVCSPAVIPRVFDDKYYLNSVAVANNLLGLVKDHKVHVLQTALVSLAELTVDKRVLEVASIISGTDAKRVYLIFVGTTPPRRELSDVEELVGALRLIQSLEQNDLPVLVGFCSSDILLWKTAGATSCASGKFFNLRRFTRQRFDEPSEGGGQLPYWFEEGLLAFLRQGDLLRVRRQGLLSESSSQNPFGREILSKFDEARESATKPGPWLATSWRQFLYWFADFEGRLDRNEITTEELLKSADANWSKLDKAQVFMEERENNGTWIRNWLNVLTEYGGKNSPGIAGSTE
jgi:hypothetical protein